MPIPLWKALAGNSFTPSARVHEKAVIRTSASKKIGGNYLCAKERELRSQERAKPRQGMLQPKLRRWLQTGSTTKQAKAPYALSQAKQAKRSKRNALSPKLKRQARPTLSTARKAKGNTELKEPYFVFPSFVFFCFTTNSCSPKRGSIP